VTVADFGNREFVRWENGETDMTRTITLEEDTAIKAIYRVTADDEDSGRVSGINAIIRLLNNHGCFDSSDDHKLGKSIGKIIEDIFGEDRGASSKLEKTLEKIMDQCEDGGSQGHGNDDNRGRGHGGNDD
jgi:hypothetical protein